MKQIIGAVIVGVLCVVVFVRAEGVQPGSPSSHHKPLEQHHSLLKPFDSSSIYWQFGGSTVLTDKFVRLTPSTQSRFGWLWNDYALGSADWEVELELRVGSDPHIGGDGFGFWILDGSFDPANDRSLLTGPIFGVSETFKGFGVVFDTYDNDAKRDNPMIYVLKNMEGKTFVYNHDNDFENDMARSTSDGKHKCTANIRNSESPIKVMIRFVNQFVHVYVDTSESKPGRANRYSRAKGKDTQNNYRFCLGVDIGASFNGTAHFALTAMTGQVADVHDFHAITTRYLDSDDASIDDLLIPTVDDYIPANSSNWSWLFWFLIVLCAVGLTLETLYEISSFMSLKTDQINSVYLCNKINRLILPHYIIQLGMTLLFVVTTNWTAFFLNLPLASWRIYLLIQQKHRLEPSQFDARGNGFYTNVLYASAVNYGVVTFYYILRLSSL